MGLLQDWGGQISDGWKGGSHWIEQAYKDSGNFIDRKMPELKFDVKADIDAKININKDNFNVRMDSTDIAAAGSAIGSGVSSGLSVLGTAIGNSLEQFGQNLSKGLEALGAELGTNVQQGLSQLGESLTGAAATLTTGITSHGTSIENAALQLGRVATGGLIQASSSMQNGLALVGKSVERFDATGGFGRHVMTTAQYAQAAGQKLLALDEYFSRVSGEGVDDVYLLKVSNTSLRPLAGLEFLANVTLCGIGGTNYFVLQFLTGMQARFTLSFRGQTTGRIPADASAAVIQTVLESLASIGTGNVICSGDTIADGPIEIVLTGALSGQTDPITVSGSQIIIQFYRRVPQLTFSTIVSGDPFTAIFDKQAGSVIKLGGFRPDFGVPYVSAVTLEMLPSPQRDIAAEQSRILRGVALDAGGNEVPTSDYNVNQRRSAAEQLSELGSYAWDELATLELFLRLATDLDPIVRQAAMAAIKAIKTFALDATASVVVSSADVFEPVSMLRAHLQPTILAPPPSGGTRLPVSLDRSGTARSTSIKPKLVLPVNDADLSPASLTAARMLATTTAHFTGTFQDAIDQALELGKELRQVTLPDPFKSDVVPRTFYDLAREVLGPTFEQLRAAVTLYNDLSADFVDRFKSYGKRRAYDPCLTHLLGMELLDANPTGIRVLISITVTDVQTGAAETETLGEIGLRSPNGEALVPIPLRFIDNGLKDVTIQLTPSSPSRILLTHFSGLVGDFAILRQVVDNKIDFQVLRMVARVN
jgi:hypothetical protein